MIKNFLEYILESESNGMELYLSEALSDLLKGLSSSDNLRVNKISKYLLSLNGSDNFKSDITYIDKTDKNDMLSFIQSNRVRKMYDESGVGYDFDRWSYEKFTSDEEIWKKQRNEIKIGKFVKKISKSEFSDVEIESFVNAYRANFDFTKDDDSKFSLVSGEDIKKWYYSESYLNQRGTLGSSCMRGSSCQKYFKIYTENPDVCNLLIIFSDFTKTKIEGRALVWKTTDGDTVMDRIYTNNGYLEGVFKIYAKQRNWKYIYDTELKMEIQLTNFDFDYYPYLDNFLMLNPNSGILSNDEQLHYEDGYLKLQDTNGSYSSGVVWSSYSDEEIERESAVYCEGARDWVWSHDAIWLNYLSRYASPAEEISYSDYTGESFYLDDCVFSEVLNTYILADNSVEIYYSDLDDTDYVPNDLDESIFVEVKGSDGKMKTTIDRLTFYDPISDRLYFAKDSIDNEGKISYNGINICDYVYNQIGDIEVDVEKIKNYLLESKFIDINKLNSLEKIEGVDVVFPQDREMVMKCIKYLLYAYPNQKNQRNGLPKIPNRNLSERVKFGREIENFDKEFLEEILGISIDNWHDTFDVSLYFSLTKITKSFINDIFVDKDILLMWYKWKSWEM